MKTTIAQLISRYLWLLNTIYEAGEYGITLEEINQRWRNCAINEDHSNEIPRRTFIIYKSEIESMFDVSIVVARRDGHYRYSVADDESIRNREIKRLMLNSMLINEMVTRDEGMKDRVLMERVPSADSNALSVILNAIRSNHVLQMHHASYKKGSAESVSEVWPFCVKLREQRWYLFAYKPADNGFRLYGIDRIVKCSIQDERFDAARLPVLLKKLHGVSSAKEYFNDFYGVMTDESVPLMDITVRVFSDQYVRYFRSLPLHGSQTEVDTVEGKYADFRYHIHPTIDFTRKLLSYGQYVMVLSPEQYQNEISQAVASAANLYR